MDLSNFTEVPTSLEVGDLVVRIWQGSIPWLCEVLSVEDAISLHQVTVKVLEDVSLLGDPIRKYSMRILRVEPTLIKEMRKAL